MEKKKIAIVGVGGRTGTMFDFELKKTAEVLGVGKENEIEMIKQKKVYIDRDGRLEIFEGKVIKNLEFKENLQPDFILLATKNPVGPPIKFYYSKFKEAKKIPTLLISQNGFSPFQEAENALKEIFGKDFEKIKIVRLVLFNPIQKKEIKNKIFISYSSPIKIALTCEEIEDLIEIFKRANFKIEVFPEKEVKNLEFSKLFLNLIGMASASRGFSVREGFSNWEILKEEVKNKILITYSLPIRIALAKAPGPGEIEDLIEIFKKANFEVEIFPEKEAKNLEFSKLFLNLIGMASASRGFSVREGFSNWEIFKEEIEILKEYIEVVKASGGKFFNFSHYPVKFLAHLLELIPTNLFLVFESLLVKIVGQKREEKPKDLDEIEYYNGAVVNLGKKMGIKTPVNERIYKRVLEKLAK